MAKAYVAELVTLAPDVFLANSTPVVAALRQATTSIPIVFAVFTEPFRKRKQPKSSRQPDEKERPREQQKPRRVAGAGF